MPYNFDKIIDRKNTDSLKYDFAVNCKKPENILPLWVADMDFKAPEAVLDALVQKSRHGIFGYSNSREDYFEVLRAWFLKRFGWEIQSDWLLKTPGVVFAVCAAIRALTNEGDSVLIQQPVYYPFTEAVNANKRRLIVNQLVYVKGRYEMDLKDFENKIIKNNVKLFILCSPHNPVGRVWSKDELIAMGDICVKHGVVVVSDEIHADFTYPGFFHSVFMDLKPEFSDIAITCTAPTKTFNLAGLHISNILIKNKDLRSRFKQEINRTGYSQPNIMGIIACKAAYESCEPWLLELLAYLSGNLDFLRAFLQNELPNINLVEPEGTYLAWLDCKALGLSDRKLDHLIVHKANLWLDTGSMFGAGGEGFQRINIACPRAVLKQALTQLKQAIEK